MVAGVKTCSRLLSRPALAALFSVVSFLKASLLRSFRPLSATSGGNPRSVDRMTAALLCRSCGAILGDVHGLEGPVDGIIGGAVFHPAH